MNEYRSNRREFIGHLTKGAAVAALYGAGAFSTLELEGCSAESIFTDIKNWVPVGVSAFNAILAVLTGNGIIISPVVGVIENAIQAAFNAITAAVAEYQSTNPPPTGALQKVEAAIQAVTDQFGNFLAALSIPTAGIFTLVKNLVSVILSTIAAFAAKLPASLAIRFGSTMTSFRLNGQLVQVTPKERSRRRFKRDWNSVVESGKKEGAIAPPDAYLKLTFGEKLAIIADPVEW